MLRIPRVHFCVVRQKNVLPSNTRNVESVCGQRYKQRCLEIKEIRVHTLKSLMILLRAVPVEESGVEMAILLVE